MTGVHSTKKMLKHFQWIIHPEGLSDQETVLKSRQDAAKPSLEFFVLLIISIVIATVGLIDNSAAVIIGAMIIAPLMDPIVSLAFGISTYNKRLIRQSITLIASGTIIVVITSGLIYQALGINFVDNQMLSRTAPNLIDLSVAIAAGMIGAFAQSRSKIASSMAGVAIAVALVPPLCVTGIGLKLSAQASLRFNEVIIPSLSHQIPEGAFLLFLTNLVGITSAGMAVFLAQNYGSIHKCWKFALSCLAITALLCAPLTKSLQEFTMSKNIEEVFKDYRLSEMSNTRENSNYASFWRHTRVMYCNTKTEDETIKLDLVLQAPKTDQTESILKTAFEDIEEKIEKKSNYTLDSTISVVGNYVYEFNSDNSKKRLPSGS